MGVDVNVLPLRATELNYHDELKSAMRWLADQPGVVFLGQGVGNAGTSMSSTFDGVDAAKRIEMPVAEEMQIGMCVGMSLSGYVPVCVVPRWNFMLRAADQIINHLDRLPLYSAHGYMPNVIIRVAAPSTHPFDPQSQHGDNFTDAFRLMLKTVTVVDLIDPASVLSQYQRAFYSYGSTILVEHTDFYRNARATSR